MREEISGMTEAAHDDYQLPEEFEHCLKLAPVRDAPSALDRVKQVVRICTNQADALGTRADQHESA